MRHATLWKLRRALVEIDDWAPIVVIADEAGVSYNTAAHYLPRMFDLGEVHRSQRSGGAIYRAI
jgi:hypothetical protein